MQACTTVEFSYRGRIVERNWDKSLKSFPRYSHSTLLTDFTPRPLPLNKSGLKLVYIVKIVYENLKSGENSPVYAQKPQRNCTFMISASVGERGREKVETVYFRGKLECYKEKEDGQKERKAKKIKRK